MGEPVKWNKRRMRQAKMWLELREDLRGGYCPWQLYRCSRQIKWRKLSCALKLFSQEGSEATANHNACLYAFPGLPDCAEPYSRALCPCSRYGRAYVERIVRRMINELEANGGDDDNTFR